MGAKKKLDLKKVAISSIPEAVVLLAALFAINTYLMGYISGFAAPIQVGLTLAYAISSYAAMLVKNTVFELYAVYFGK